MHLNYLDGTRAVAALYILMHHILMQIAYGESFHYELLHSIFQYGRAAVDVFIVLSGFCLMIPLVKENRIISSRNFLKRRSIRILPAYYSAMGLSLILIYTIIGEETGSHWDAAIPVTAWDILTHILLIHDLFPETVYKINHTFWSISVECRIYLLFPIILNFCKNYGIILMTFVSIILSFILWHGYSKIGLNSYTMAPHYLSLFMFGMTSCYVSFTKNLYYSRIKHLHLNQATVGIIFILILCIIIKPIVLPDLILSTLISDYIIGAITAILLLCISTGKMNILIKILSWQPLVFIGTFAYSIYLIHAPILEIISRHLVLPLELSQNLNLLLMITLGLSISLTLSYLFFLTAEKPYIKRKNRVEFA